MAPEQQSPEANVLARVEQTAESYLGALASLKEDARQRFRGTRHDLTTNKGVVSFLNEAINGFVLDPDGEVVGRNELNTLGYVCGVQLRAIQAVQDEENPETTIQDLLGRGTNIEIRMTREERKMLLTAGTPENMAKILQEVKNDGRIIDMEQQGDGSFAVKPMENPPRTDAPMPHGLLADAINAEGGDTTRRELKALLGPSLGGAGDTQELEAFGFESLMDVSPKTEPALAHDWQTISATNPDLPGAVIRLSKCTKCGITTKNSQRNANEICGDNS